MKSKGMMKGQLRWRVGRVRGSELGSDGVTDK
jgi:hypothetical protein